MKIVRLVLVATSVVTLVLNVACSSDSSANRRTSAAPDREAGGASSVGGAGAAAGVVGKAGATFGKGGSAASAGSGGSAGGHAGSSTGGAAPSAKGANTSADVACSLKPQAGCGDNSTCLIANASGVTSCYGAGPAAYGEACTQINDCQRGLLCLYGQCREICLTASDCSSAPAAVCKPYPDNKLPGLNACSIQCNPLDSANVARDPDFIACPENQACSTISQQGTTDCFAAGPVKEGGNCASEFCGPNLVCLNDVNSGSKTCRPFCSMNEPKCAQGSCQKFATPSLVDIQGQQVELGFCG